MNLRRLIERLLLGYEKEELEAVHSGAVEQILDQFRAMRDERDGLVEGWLR